MPTSHVEGLDEWDVLDILGKGGRRRDSDGNLSNKPRKAGALFFLFFA